MLYLANGTPQKLYLGMQRYVLIGLMKLYWSELGDNIIPNSICINFKRIVYMFFIKEEIIPNPPFQFSGSILVIISVSRNVDFRDTR